MFSAFTPLAGGQLNTYLYPSESPFNFDAGLDYTRPATGFSPFPYPLVTGYQAPLTPLLDNFQLAIMKGPLPMGPDVNMLSGGNMPVYAFPNTAGGMMKVGG